MKKNNHNKESNAAQDDGIGSKDKGPLPKEHAGSKDSPEAKSELPATTEAAIEDDHLEDLQKTEIRVNSAKEAKPGFRSKWKNFFAKKAPGQKKKEEKVKATADNRAKDNAEEKNRKKEIADAHLDEHLSRELSRLHDLKKKRIFSKKKEHRFTVRGFAKAITLQENLEKAGLDLDARELTRTSLKIDLAICVVIYLGLMVQGFFNGSQILSLVILSIGFWLTIPLLTATLLWIVYLFYLDLKIYQRTKEVEAVFPDFLQLASSNISAGMPIDKALWYAVRPNFGVLVKEIENVAKNTMAGEDLADALRDFSRKYDSKVIRRSISLILEGLASGGKLADLLSKIAIDIEETRIIKRDMAANVMTYVIFISFATIVAAPVLLGLATQLLGVIQTITSKMGTSMASSSSFFKFSFASGGLSVTNFKIFAYVMLTISSISAACIVNVIQKGTAKEGLIKIPIFIMVSALLYFASSALMAGVFAGLLG